MNTVDKLFAATAEIWKSYNEHPFVLGIQNGTFHGYSYDRHRCKQDPCHSI